MQATGERWRTTPGWRLFGAIFIIVFGLFAIWSVAMPLISGPDEPAHVVKAAGVIRGQFVGSCGDNSTDQHGVCPAKSPFAEVHVPAYYSIVRPGAIPAARIAHHGVTCFARHPDVPANCLTLYLPPSWANKSANAWTYVARYPPLYYAIAGLPTLVFTGPAGLYLMRLLSAAASALMVSLAVFSVLRYSRNRLLLLGIVVAATPMVLYLGGIVNPSGLETTSALSFWTMATIMVRDFEERPPRALIVMAAFAAIVFASIRALSPFWLALSVLAVVAIADWRTLKTLLTRNDVRIAIALVVVVCLADAVWIIHEHATNLNVSSANAQALIPSPSTSEFTILRTSFHHNIYYLPGMIGVFGDFDTYATHSTFIIWYLLGGALLLLALLAGTLRRRFVVVAVALGIVILPVLISSSQARHIGYVWSGRDTLPFAVGLPILCASVIDNHRMGRLLRFAAPLVLFLAFAAQARAFFWVLRRYSVGEAGPRLSFLFHSPWSPPAIGCLGALIIEVAVLCLAYFGVLYALGTNIGRLFMVRSRRAIPADADEAKERVSIGD